MASPPPGTPPPQAEAGAASSSAQTASASDRPSTSSTSREGARPDAAGSSSTARERTHSAERSGEHGSHRSEGRSDGRSDGSFVSHASSTSNRRYVLTVVQQPQGSAEFGAAVLSRLPLSPPLIVQLQCFDLENQSVDIDSNLPFLFSHLTLLPSSEASAARQDPTAASSSTTPSSTPHHHANPLDVVTDTSAANPQPLRMLYGTLVSSPHELVLRTSPTEEPKRGVFFVFPDVSVRIRGTYRLGVGLMRIAAPPGDPSNPPTHETLAFISTDDFVIAPLADYIAPGPTPLTSNLAEQGVQMFLSRHR